MSPRVDRFDEPYPLPRASVQHILSVWMHGGDLAAAERAVVDYCMAVNRAALMERTTVVVVDGSGKTTPLADAISAAAERADLEKARRYEDVRDLAEALGADVKPVRTEPLWKAAPSLLASVKELLRVVRTPTHFAEKQHVIRNAERALAIVERAA